MIKLQSIILENLKDKIRLMRVSREDVVPFIQKHYLKKFPPSIKQIYGVYYILPRNFKMIGMVIYGSAWNRAKIMFEPMGIKLDEIMDLKRLYLEDIGLKNLESFVIAQSLKMLMNDFPNVKIVLTYAWEGAGHIGTIYQATNAIYLGKSAKGMHKYAYVLRGNTKNIRKMLPQQPYPKIK
jgi:hypothetical protein